MFYSHEILQSPQYGVATIWLVATNSAARKVTRRAIEDVNLYKACEKIIEPGAPIALRVQGNLLYGVSRVYEQKTRYILADAEKIKADMRMFERSRAIATTDPKAGKTSRRALLVEDDPAFDPTREFAEFTFNPTLDLDKILSQKTTRTSSQMSPSTHNGYPSSPHHSVSFNLDGSDGGSFQIPSPYGLGNAPSSVQKTPHYGHDDPFLVDELGNLDLGIEFNADGEEVPAGTNAASQPPVEFDPMNLDMGFFSISAPGTRGAVHCPDEMFDMPPGEPAARSIVDPFADELAGQPDALQPETQQPQEQTTQTRKVTKDRSAHQRRKTRFANKFLDVGGTIIDSAEYYDYIENYVENMEALNDARARKVTAAQSRKIAYHYVFGRGINDIAIDFGGFKWDHPLVSAFSGKALEKVAYPERAAAAEKSQDMSTPEISRRRSTMEAFGSPLNDKPVRRVRTKQGPDSPAEKAGELAIGGPKQQAPDPFADELDFEMGRDAPNQMEDRRSSTIMPWTRQPSLGPRSLQGSAKKPSSRLLGSPMSSQLDSGIDFADRFSDSLGPAPSTPTPAALAPAETTQNAAAAGLDTSSEEFLGFVKAHAEESGVARPGNKKDAAGRRRWVGFGDMISPEVQAPPVAAHAFYHLLCLASKGEVAVSQDGADEGVPFGEINVGVSL